MATSVSPAQPHLARKPVVRGMLKRLSVTKTGAKRTKTEQIQKTEVQEC